MIRGTWRGDESLLRAAGSGFESVRWRNGRSGISDLPEEVRKTLSKRVWTFSISVRHEDRGADSEGRALLRSGTMCSSLWGKSFSFQRRIFSTSSGSSWFSPFRHSGVLSLYRKNGPFWKRPLVDDENFKNSWTSYSCGIPI